MSKVIAAIGHQIGIGAVLFNVIDPCATESRVAITTSKLASTVKRNFKRSEIKVFFGWCSECMIKFLYRVNFTFVYTVRDIIPANIFYLPAVFTPAGTLAFLHLLTLHFFLLRVVQCFGIALDFIHIYSMR